ncbi:hypothetical protein CUZ56_00004 [Saezia sanguinis]|uniref:Uncharacterized protein n=1 Tax=Saezia sanguinis TaxID=1965230 RepID=A0A433SFN8_9BURK|nr:hypothetical protein CUZ56_00004 [Saezia sanguinis]
MVVRGGCGLPGGNVAACVDGDFPTGRPGMDTAAVSGGDAATVRNGGSAILALCINACGVGSCDSQYAGIDHFQAAGAGQRINGAGRGADGSSVANRDSACA